jgi:hypothetical protein
VCRKWGGECGIYREERGDKNDEKNIKMIKRRIIQNQIGNSWNHQ